MSNITFTEQAWDEYIYWQSRDQKILRKINTLLKSIQRTPFVGEGKPEPLKGVPNKWSRRINEKDRLVTSNLKSRHFAKFSQIISKQN